MQRTETPGRDPAPIHDAPTLPLSRRALRQTRHLPRILVVIFLVFVTVGELGWWRMTATVTNFAGEHFNQGQNALWLAHTWVGEPHAAADYDAIADRLQREQITFAYVHVGPLDGNGTIPADRYTNAAAFVTALHQRAPQTKLLAWIGQIYRPGAQAGDAEIDLAIHTTRQQIATTAAIFTHDLGFDGIHYDIEPVQNNDNHFLDLLDETRTAIGHSSILSIATPNWVPIARVTAVFNGITNRRDVWWTTYYYQTVSRHVDQVVAMMYNTGMPTAPLYEAIVEQETAHILRDVEQGSAHTRVIIGIPTYTAPPTRAFHANAENMRTGLQGVISGLNYDTWHTAFAGVAIYPEWLTTDADWATYESEWLGQ